MVELPSTGCYALSERVTREGHEQLWRPGFGYHVLMCRGGGDVVDDVSNLHIGFQSGTEIAMCCFRESGQFFSWPFL
jgi:hypothetical protein